MAKDYPEKQVLEIWQNSLQGRVDLLTVDREPVEIIYPGRLNDDRGADLRDAIIATRRGRFRGDIEIHVRSSRWWAHEHHKDPEYNRVILHVVYRDDAGKPAELASGATVPTLELFPYCRTAAFKTVNITRLPPLPCRNTLCLKDTGEILDRCGDERFQINVNRYCGEIARRGPAEALYTGIMTGLGYSKNKAPMAVLTEKIPLARLENTTTTDEDYLIRCQALLLGTAGLLPGQRGFAFQSRCLSDGWVEKLENAWAEGGATGAMAAGDWQFFKVRPGNYPPRRIGAMSHLLLRYRTMGLFRGLQAAYEKAGDKEPALERSLTIPGDGYWENRADFGVELKGQPAALLGTERAGEIIVNTVLPFAAAGGFGGENPVKALSIYGKYHAPPENTLVKHTRQQLRIERALVNTARRQQGLLHIYKTWCCTGQCGGCPLHPAYGEKAGAIRERIETAY
jgi:hypothetical protein